MIFRLYPQASIFLQISEDPESVQKASVYPSGISLLICVIGVKDFFTENHSVDKEVHREYISLFLTFRQLLPVDCLRSIAR